jgi:hypothetical protein
MQLAWVKKTENNKLLVWGVLYPIANRYFNGPFL